MVDPEDSVCLFFYLLMTFLFILFLGWDVTEGKKEDKNKTTAVEKRGQREKYNVRRNRRSTG